MAHPRRHFIDTSFGQIHVRIATPDTEISAPALLCLHQSPKSGRTFAKFMPPMSQDRIVIAADYPGYGESVIPPEDPPIRIQDYARVIWEVIDALGHEKIDILGHHTGSKVAVEMAYQRTESVHHMVLVSALVLTDTEREAYANMFQPIPLDEAGTRFIHMWDMIKKYRGPGMTLEMMAQSMAENMRGGEAYEWGHQAAFAYNEFFPDRLAGLAHQINIVNPGDDLFELTPRAGKLLQNGRVIDHPEWGHGFFSAFSEDAATAIRRYLK